MYIHISPRAKPILKIKDPGMYFIRFLLTTDFVALNTLSPPAGNATPAGVPTPHPGEAKREMIKVVHRLYYMFCFDTGLLTLNCKLCKAILVKEQNRFTLNF